jgi:hypothetical protein
MTQKPDNYTVPCPNQPVVFDTVADNKPVFNWTSPLSGKYQHEASTSESLSASTLFELRAGICCGSNESGAAFAAHSCMPIPGDLYDFRRVDDDV